MIFKPLISNILWSFNMKVDQKKLYQELLWFNLPQNASGEDLLNAKRQETYLSYAMRNKLPRLTMESKIDFLIYKNEMSN